MDANNVAVLRGTVSKEPLVRELPGGRRVTQVEVLTPLADGTTVVPVAVHDTEVTVVEGDDVVVVGYVNRRFFRVGGSTQSRTEVIAEQLVKATRRKTVERAVAAAVEALA